MMNILAAGRRAAVIVVLVLAGAAAAGPAHAQPSTQPRSGGQPKQQPSGPPNALQGFSQNRDKPVKITADELEVRDKDKIAVFSGGVHLVQGDTSLRSSSLVVYYDNQASAQVEPPKPGKGAAASAQITPQQNQQIKRVEAKGKVEVKQNDQIANGDEGIFDMRANTVTMLGSVIISKGPNVLKGDKLTVNMNTGDSAMTCNGGKGPERPCKVQGLFFPGSMKQGEGGLIPLPGRKP